MHAIIGRDIFDANRRWLSVHHIVSATTHHLSSYVSTMAAISEMLDLRAIFAIMAIFAIVYPFYLAVVRLYFSPIAGFPGPKLAAASFWYEFYYDFWKSGKYIYEIKKMHEKYGKSSVLSDPTTTC
jgi:hypothetical protein